MASQSLPNSGSPHKSIKQETSPSSVGIEKECILIVDDDEAIHRFMTTVLVPAGYAVLLASSGQEAIELCERQEISIQLAIVDGVMPKLSGRQSVSQMLTVRPGLKVLLMSGYPTVTGLIDGIDSRAGAPKFGFDFIEKPILPGVILAKIREILDRPQVV